VNKFHKFILPSYLNPYIISKRFILTLGILLISLRAVAQPPETIYEGILIASGFRQSISAGSDGPFPIGFSFTFFGNSYTQFYVSANGLVMFTDPDDTYNTETTIPTPIARPDNFIAPFWDNLSIVDGGNILYRTIGASPGRKCIIQFKNMGFDPIPTPLGTFSVILYETSDSIQMQYRLIVDPFSPDSHGGSASIGLENVDGSYGVQFAYQNGNAVHTEDAISFKPSGATNYTINSNAIYDGVFLTTNTTLPDPGIVKLISPSANAIIGANQNFEWSAATNATSYTLVIDVSPDLSSATYYDAGSNLSYNITGLTLDQTYYWAVFSSNSTALTWGEERRFTTSSTPPLTAVPREFWVAQGDQRGIKLQFTGGDLNAKTAIIQSLPAQGQLYQVSGGIIGDLITTFPTTVFDPLYNLIYVANGGTGNGAGSFKFRFHDGTGYSSESTITINVNPPGVPNFLNASRNENVELQFDRIMNDPYGKHNQFTVTVDSKAVPVISASSKTGDPTSIVLTLGTSLSVTDTVFVSYLQGDVSATTGGLLASFTDQPVTLQAQTIIFTTDLTKIYGDPLFGLSASATSGLPITFSSSNLTVATISSNIVTIHAVGTSDLTALQAGDAIYGPARYVRTLTVSEPATKTLSLSSVLLQGLYNGGGLMRQAYDDLGPHWPSGVADHITVELHSAANYATVIYTASNVVLNTNGTATVFVPSGNNGSYYITIKHRNSIETTTATPVSFAGSIITQSFVTQSNVYGGNLVVSSDGYFLIYGGDVNQDGSVDTGDFTPVANDVSTYIRGYLATDIDGNGSVDTGDYLIMVNNNANYVRTYHP
jgi:hypothetical protein